MIKKVKRGSIVFIMALTILIFMVLITFFSIIVFKHNVNLVLHNLKNDLYLISRNSVFSIERNLMAEDVELIDYMELRSYIVDEIRHVWGLNANLRNGKGIIKNAKIEEMTILEEGDIDSLNNKKAECLTVHLVVGIKVKPIIFNKIFDDIFYFKIHEDLKLNKLQS